MNFVIGNGVYKRIRVGLLGLKFDAQTCLESLTHATASEAVRHAGALRRCSCMKEIELNWNMGHNTRTESIDSVCNSH